MIRQIATKIISVLVGAAALVGCTRIPEADSSGVTALTQPRIGKRADWIQGTQEDQLVHETVTLLLQNELSLDAAIHISLLNNHGLQALYEEIGVSQADLVQAGLLQNPLVGIGVGFSNDRGSSTSTQFSIAQNFIDIFSLSLRKKYAQLRAEQTELEIAHAILAHVAAVETAYYRLQGETTRRSLFNTIVDIETASTNLSERQLLAGNVFMIDVCRHQQKLFDAKITLVKSDAEILVLKEKFNELLGLSGKENHWSIPQTLPALPAKTDLPDIEKIALNNRLDLKIAKKEVELIAQSLGLHKWWGYTEAQIGLVQEKDSEGISSFGPTATFAIPIFDSGQAKRAKLQAQLRQKYQQILAKVTSIRAEVRAAKETLFATIALTELLQQKIIPLQQETVALSQTLYNSMSISPYNLLEAKRDEILAKIEYTNALQGSWIASIELGKKVGGKLFLNAHET